MKIEIDLPEIKEGQLDVNREGTKKVVEELACRLYEKGVITFGQGREMTGLGFVEFQKALAQREIPRMTLESFMLEINQRPTHAGNQ